MKKNEEPYPNSWDAALCINCIYGVGRNYNCSCDYVAFYAYAKQSKEAQIEVHAYCSEVMNDIEKMESGILVMQKYVKPGIEESKQKLPKDSPFDKMNSNNYFAVSAAPIRVKESPAVIQYKCRSKSEPVMLSVRNNQIRD